MKKTVLASAALLAAAMMALPVMAAEDEAGSTIDNPVIFNYEDIDTSVYEGVWTATGLGFDVYIPEDWEVSELTDEMLDAGIQFVAGEDEEEGGANMVIVSTPIPEDQVATYDLEQLGTELSQTYPSAMYADLSGIPAVIFDDEENEVAGYSFLTEDGYIISGVMSGPKDVAYNDYGPYFLNMLMSVSPTIESETEAE